MMRGITVKLHVKKQTGEDDFGRPQYSDDTVDVDNVLIGQPTSEDILSTNQFGHHVAYTLGIPKGDKHSWEDTEVDFWGRKWHTVGVPVQGIDDMVPLAWGKNVMVEAYE